MKTQSTVFFLMAIVRGKGHAFKRIKRHKPVFLRGNSDSSRVSGNEMPAINAYECAELYRDTLNYINNFFEPDYTLASKTEGQDTVRECAHGYLIRRGMFNREQQEELSFQLELNRGLNPGKLRKNPPSLVQPSLVFLRNQQAFAEYEFGLVYLLFCSMERHYSAARMQIELQDLWTSWTHTMEPPEGHLSKWLIRIAISGVEWWSALTGYRAGYREMAKLDILMAVQGAAAGVAGQRIGDGNYLASASDIEWGKTGLAVLQGALNGSIFEIPRIRKWLEKLADDD